MKAGFVNIFGRPNAGKSTLLNALLDEKLAIVSPKVQTTRHRIKGFLTKPGEYQVIFSDTPGIIEPKYKLHEKMMSSVKSALEDADVALLLVDINDNLQENNDLFTALKLKAPTVLVINKTDACKAKKIQEAEKFFAENGKYHKIVFISALGKKNLDELKSVIIELLPEGEAFYDEDDLTDLPTKFFVSEMIREKIMLFLSDEIPYHTTVLINEYKEKESLVKIQADIIVQRESQKAIIIGEKGSMIKKIGIAAREDIEKFIERKVLLQLFVKVRPKWRDNDLYLKEYGYH